MDFRKVLGYIQSILYELLPIRPSDAWKVVQYFRENGKVLLKAVVSTLAVCLKAASTTAPAYWLVGCAWLGGFVWTTKSGFGQTYVLFSITIPLLVNGFAERKEGDVSAYSVFNGFQRLIGAAEQNLEDEMDRAGMRQRDN